METVDWNWYFSALAQSVAALVGGAVSRLGALVLIPTTGRLAIPCPGVHAPQAHSARRFVAQSLVLRSLVLAPLHKTLRRHHPPPTGYYDLVYFATNAPKSQVRVLLHCCCSTAKAQSRRRDSETLPRPTAARRYGGLAQLQATAEGPRMSRRHVSGPRPRGRRWLDRSSPRRGEANGA